MNFNAPQFLIATYCRHFIGPGLGFDLALIRLDGDIDIR